MSATAIQALHRPVLTMSARQRPPLWLARRPGEVVFAVFDDEPEPLLGVVGWRDLVAHPQRIFADQVPQPAPEALDPATPVEACLDALHRQRVGVLAVVSPDGAFRGAVTEASLLQRAVDGPRGASRRLERAVDEVGRLEAMNLELAGTLHDVRNELQVALATLSLAVEGDAPFGLAGIGGDLDGMLSRAVALCRQVPVGRPTARLRPELVELGVLLDGLLPALRTLVRDPGEVVVSGDPSLVALVDPMDLERVLLNIVKNSADAAAGRAARVSVVVSEVGEPAWLPSEAWLAPAPHVQITVTDDGPGMSDEQLRRISAGTELDALHGVGLVTVRRLIRRNGGTIRCRSHLGHGTTTELVLPRAMPRDLAPVPR